MQRKAACALVLRELGKEVPWFLSLPTFQSAPEASHRLHAVRSQRSRELVVQSLQVGLEHRAS